MVGVASQSNGRPEERPASPSIQLPKGGGAIRGIGEKFAANPVTGAGSMSVPIATSPGRSGFGPLLSLAYDSGSGNGPFGFGWGLSLPSITRKTDKGLPRYSDADGSDVFVLSGAEDLVPVLEGPSSRTVSGTTYRVEGFRPRIEGLFARIERWTNTADAADVFWRSISRDNVTSWYGRTPDCRIADPADTGRVFSWLICLSHDDRGNAVVYGYKAEDSAGIAQPAAHERHRTNESRSAQRYLKRIRYGNRLPYFPDSPLAEPADDWHFEVVFDYGEHDAQAPTPGDAGAWPARPDPFSSYRAGFEVRTYRICQRVLMFHHFPDAQGVGRDCLVRSTDFTYSDDAIYSFLRSVSQSGYRRDDNGYAQRSLPPVEFEYSEPVVQDEVREAGPAELHNLPIGLDGNDYRWIDLHGEGIPGILTEQAGAWFYKRNLSPIQPAMAAAFAPLETVAIKPNVGSDGAEFMDLAGDGQPDVVVTAGPVPGLYEHDEAEGWQPFRPFTSRLNHDLRDPNLRLVDLNGDGHADVLISEDHGIVWHPSLAEEGFGRASRVTFAEDTLSLHLADLSGDGLTDLVRIRNGEVCYWPNLGYGRFGAKVTMDNAPLFDHPDQFDRERVRLADIDGSGTTDIIYLHRDGVRLYFNESGNGWSQPRALKAFPRIDDTARVAPVDLLGNGTTCLVWSSPSPGDGRRPLRYVNLMGDSKPHLLIKANNNLGTETRVKYATSTKFYLQDRRDGRPWATRLPFPTHVIERVETYDRVGRNRFVTRYAYHHGYFDGEEREFRGFGMVEQWDTEQFEALLSADNSADNVDAASHVPPVHTKTWFHTGADLPPTVLPQGLTAQEDREARRALKGSMLRQEVYADDGGPRAQFPYSVVEQNFSIRMLQPRDANRHAVFLTHARETLSSQYERNPEDPRVQHALTLEVDEHGNVLKEAVVGYGRRTTIGGSPNERLAELHPADQAKQTTTLLTYSEARFTNAVNGPDVHRAPLPCESRSFELTGYTPTGPGGHFQASDLVETETSSDQSGVRLRFSAPDVPYEATASGAQRRRLIDWRRTVYRRDDLDGLAPLGDLPPLALPGESYQLAFTSGLLAQVFQRPKAGGPTEALLPDPAAVAGGYLSSQELKADNRFPAGDPDDHWWMPSGRIFYTADPAGDPVTELAQARQHFFVPRRYRDAFGNDSFVDFDAHDLLMTGTRDAMDNRVTVAANDYRVLQPRLVSDANGNQTEVSFDTLGMLAGTAVMGKPAPAPVEGDTLAGFVSDLTQAELDGFFDATDPHAVAPSLLRDATSRVIYDLDRFRRTGQPACAATLSRETHASGPLPPQGLRIQVSFTYSDGFGREIQSMIPAEPGPQGVRWVGSGWTIFNNKGKPVREFEPFFSATHQFQFGVEAGVSPVLFYDPLERIVTVLHPNHTHERAAFDAWQKTTYDVNDTCTHDPRVDADIAGFVAGYFATQPANWRTRHAERIEGALGENERAAAERAAAHADTPTTVHFDALGRPFLTVARNRVVCPGHDLDGSEHSFSTRVELDIEGNQRAVRDAVEQAGDPLGRVVMRHEYDMVGNVLHQHSMEAGARWMLNDVAGKPIRAWDSRGHDFTTAYDTLRRPIAKTVRGTTAESDPRTLGRDVTLEVIEYGEGVAGAEALNLRTQIFRHMDSAGVVTNALYDFKGNLLRSTRRLVSEYTAIPDWLADPALEAEEFESATRYDALNRPIQFVAPRRNVVQLVFNEANLPERVDVWLERAAEPTTLLDPAADPPSPVGVANIDYDAKGQRTRVDFKNGAHTIYAYDPLTHRLTDLITRRDGGDLQNLHYTFDPAGNITHIRDDAQQDVFFRNQRVEPSKDYIYDALYRLIQADGREHLGQGGAPIVHSHDDAGRVGLPHPGDGTAMGRYLESYVYDAAGNFQQMRHHGTDPAHAGWTRGYEYLEASLTEPAKTSNRLTRTTGDPVVPYDPHGNMLRLPHLGGDADGPNMHWNCHDQLRQVDLGGGGTAHYLYDATGRRIRKVWEKAPGLTEERIYLGGFELFRRHNGPIGTDTVKLERETLHVIDGDQRMAMVETRTVDTVGDDAAARQLIRYQFGDHLGTASLELDDQARIISYEEYTPYGSSTYQAQFGQTETPKRYRYTGTERDDESGLNYHGARYYAAWLGRWTSGDPIRLEGGINLYRYAACAPTTLQDTTGTDPKPPMTVKEQAAIAEDAGKSALVKKYSPIDAVADVTPASKNVSANGVDVHLIVGKGDKAINVIGDTKFAGPSKDGGLAPENYSGKEKAGHVSSFDVAAKDNYRQLVRNIRAARRAGKIDPKTAYHAIRGAKAGLVLHEVVVSGRTTGVSDAIVQKYQALVTRVDNFAETTAQRQSLDVKAALGKHPAKSPPSVASLNRWWTRMMGPSAAPKVAPTPPAAANTPTVTPPKPPGIVKLYGGMPGTTMLDPAPKGVGGVGVAVVATFGPKIAVKVAEEAGASEEVVEQVGFWSSVGAGSVIGFAIGAPEGGVGAVPGAFIGGIIGGAGYLAENYEFCVPFYNCSD